MSKKPTRPPEGADDVSLAPGSHDPANYTANGKLCRAVYEKEMERLQERLAVGVKDKRRAGLEVGILNRHSDLLRFHLDDDVIVAAYDVPAVPFSGEQLLHVLDEICETLNAIAADTALRARGKLCFEGIPPRPREIEDSTCPLGWRGEVRLDGARGMRCRHRSMDTRRVAGGPWFRTFEEAKWPGGDGVTCRAQSATDRHHERNRDGPEGGGARGPSAAWRAGTPGTRGVVRGPRPRELRGRCPDRLLAVRAS